MIEVSECRRSIGVGELTKLSSNRPTGVGDLTGRCSHEGLYIFRRVLVSSHQLRIRIKIWDCLLF